MHPPDCDSVLWCVVVDTPFRRNRGTSLPERSDVRLKFKSRT